MLPLIFGLQQLLTTGCCYVAYLFTATGEALSMRTGAQYVVPAATGI
jgi:hypothetical protein